MTKILIFLKLQRWPIGCLFLFFTGCKTEAHYNKFELTKADSLLREKQIVAAKKMIANAKPMIAAGNLIVRTGNDFTSESLRQFSQQDKTYSHCGIASIENDSLFVYHSLGGEWNPDQKLLRETFENFCNPQNNRGFGIFTFDFSNSDLARLDSIIIDWHEAGKTFDMDFNLYSDDKLYCAEFVAKAIHIATINRIKFNTTSIKDFTFYAVDNLLRNPHCNEKRRFRYE